MSRNGDLEAGLKLIAVDSQLPGGGRKKLSQLVAEHLDWFDAAEKRGMGWRDVIRALSAAGVTGKSGKPLSIGTLSSAVWRKRVELKRDDDARSLQASRSLSPHSRPRSPARPAKYGSPRQDVALRKDVSGGKLSRNSQISAARMGRATNVDRLVSAKPQPSTKARTDSSKDLLDSMHRTRTIRQRSDDE
jgi:hypothetical protein